MSAAAAQASQQMPFPNATGRGLKIAIIDSGINANHQHIFARTSGVVMPGVPESDIDENGQAWHDELGHGTAVAAAIQEKAPGADYYAVKLFSDSLRTTSSRLMRAIGWAIDHRMNLVNLSLGTHNLIYQPDFEVLIKQAAASGTVLICAHSEAGRPVLPGLLKGVLPVDVDWQLPRHGYRLTQVDGVTRYSASGFPRPLPGVSPARNLSGISFAVANMTGLVARACEQISSLSLHHIEEALAAEALRIQR